MYNKENIIVTTDKIEQNELAETQENELRILITDADKYGTDITAMSDFFDIYIEQLSTELRTSTIHDTLMEIPITDLGVIMM